MINNTAMVGVRLNENMERNMILASIDSSHGIPATQVLDLEVSFPPVSTLSTCNQHLLEDEITTLKRNSLHRQIRIAAGLASQSAIEQRRYSGLISQALVVDQNMMTSPLRVNPLHLGLQGPHHPPRHLHSASTAQATPTFLSYLARSHSSVLLATARPPRTFAAAFPFAPSIETSACNSNLLLDGARPLTSLIDRDVVAQDLWLHQKNAVLLRPTQSHEATIGLLSSSQFEQQTFPWATGKQGRGSDTFPVILHRALLGIDHVAGSEAIVCFLPSGNSFQIKNRFLFEKHILPVFFPKMKNFASFQRQLNLYDFKRITGTRLDRGSYYHPMFTRESPDLASLMKRSMRKGASTDRHP